MIVVYSTGCPKCKVLETKLNQAGLNYSIRSPEEDPQILSVPVMDVDGSRMDFVAAVKWVNEVLHNEH